MLDKRFISCTFR